MGVKSIEVLGLPVGVLRCVGVIGCFEACRMVLECLGFKSVDPNMAMLGCRECTNLKLLFLSM